MKNKNMKMKNKIIILLAVLFSFTTFSCSTLKELGYTPEIKMDSVGIKGLDFEGITFTCDYSISNPYPLSFSIQKVDASISCSESSYVELSTDNGIKVEARGNRKNTFTFKIPYETILKIAKETDGKESLPFEVKGAAYLDMSGIPLANMSSLELPFNVAFDVPVFKPHFSVSNARLVMPTVSELTSMLKNSGMAVTKAAKVAAQILAGKSVTEALFDGIDLNFKFVFDLNVKNEGNSSWKCNIQDCAIKSGSNDLIDLALSENELTANSNIVPVTATLNTLKMGKFIVQMINKSGEDPEFSLDSKLTFTELKYISDIPLSYSTKIPLSKISTK